MHEAHKKNNSMHEAHKENTKDTKELLDMVYVSKGYIHKIFLNFLIILCELPFVAFVFFVSLVPIVRHRDSITVKKV
jgi:hypothetical protein